MMFGRSSVTYYSEPRKRKLLLEGNYHPGNSRPTTWKSFKIVQEEYTELGCSCTVMLHSGVEKGHFPIRCNKLQKDILKGFSGYFENQYFWTVVRHGNIWTQTKISFLKRDTGIGNRSKGGEQDMSIVSSCVTIFKRIKVYFLSIVLNVLVC